MAKIPGKLLKLHFYERLQSEISLQDMWHQYCCFAIAAKIKIAEKIDIDECTFFVVDACGIYLGYNIINLKLDKCMISGIKIVGLVPELQEWYFKKFNEIKRNACDNLVCRCNISTLTHNTLTICI